MSVEEFLETILQTVEKRPIVYKRNSNSGIVGDFRTLEDLIRIELGKVAKDVSQRLFMHLLPVFSPSFLTELRLFQKAYHVGFLAYMKKN